MVRSSATYPGSSGANAWRNAAAAPSMARDISRANKVEADHIVGDMIARARALGIATPILRVAYTGLKAYEASLAD